MAPLERSDVHRAAIALENVGTVFFEYAQAVNHYTAVTRKLVKSIRDAANCKGTPEAAKSALHASAWTLDAAAEVDGKYSRDTSREYEALSGEMKKWFKKLARDEKVYDELAESLNAKMRQAGQQYERRVLKRDQNVRDEHIRYSNVLSSLGTEISEAQVAHTTSISSRHVLMMFFAGSCLARLADAQWARVTENIRRTAPGIGRVGETKAFCDVLWAEEIPGNPVPSDTVQVLPNRPDRQLEVHSVDIHQSHHDVVQPLAEYRPPSYRSDAQPPTPLSQYPRSPEAPQSRASPSGPPFPESTKPISGPQSQTEPSRDDEAPSASPSGEQLLPVELVYLSGNHLELSSSSRLSAPFDEQLYRSATSTSSGSFVASMRNKLERTENLPAELVTSPRFPRTLGIPEPQYTRATRSASVPINITPSSHYHDGSSMEQPSNTSPLVLPPDDFTGQSNTPTEQRMWTSQHFVEPESAEELKLSTESSDFSARYASRAFSSPDLDPTLEGKLPSILSPSSPAAKANDPSWMGRGLRRLSMPAGFSSAHRGGLSPSASSDSRGYRQG